MRLHITTLILVVSQVVTWHSAACADEKTASVNGGSEDLSTTIKVPGDARSSEAKPPGLSTESRNRLAREYLRRAIESAPPLDAPNDLVLTAALLGDVKLIKSKWPDHAFFSSEAIAILALKGEFENALALCHRGPQQNYQGIMMVAAQQAFAGHYASARKTANTIPAPHHTNNFTRYREQAYYFIALAYAADGNLKGMEQAIAANNQTIAQLGDAQNTVYAVELAKAGAFDDAKQIIPHLSRKSTLLVYQRIAIAQAIAGDIQGALKTNALIDAPVDRADGEIRIMAIRMWTADTDKARELAETLPAFVRRTTRSGTRDNSSAGLRALALTLAWKGDFEAARQYHMSKLNRNIGDTNQIKRRLGLQAIFDYDMDNPTFRGTGINLHRVNGSHFMMSGMLSPKVIRDETMLDRYVSALTAKNEQEYQEAINVIMSTTPPDGKFQARSDWFAVLSGIHRARGNRDDAHAAILKALDAADKTDYFNLDVGYMIETLIRFGDRKNLDYYIARLQRPALANYSMQEKWNHRIAYAAARLNDQRTIRLVLDSTTDARQKTRICVGAARGFLAAPANERKTVGMDENDLLKRIRFWPGSTRIEGTPGKLVFTWMQPFQRFNRKQARIPTARD